MSFSSFSLACLLGVLSFVPRALADPAPEAAEAPPAEASPEPTTPCTRDPQREAPIAHGDLGQGSRTVELLNSGTVEVQLRLLDGQDQPVVAGTLVVPGQGRGVFHVPPGTYHLRMRENETCQVQEGTPFTIEEIHAGVTISLTPIFVLGDHHELRDVDQEL